MKACLSPADLAQLIADDLPETIRAEHEQHLETCARCQEALELLLRQDDPGVLQRLRDAPPLEAPRLDADVVKRWVRSSSTDTDREPVTEEVPVARGPWPILPGYQILGELGRGGMGVVYKARDRRLHRPVAIKMILAGAQAGVEERLRFRREAEVVAQLHHPDIVQIHDIGESDQRPYLVLEFIDGPTLSQLLRGVPRPAREAAALVERLARAVAFAHAHGVLHRDLKPSNILAVGSGQWAVGSGQWTVDSGQWAVDSGQWVVGSDAASSLPTAHYPLPTGLKITDFGLAKRLDHETVHTKSDVILGTPSYMAPELAQGPRTAVGPGVDIYALGAIFYELLTGRPPFRADSAMDTILQLMHQEPVRPSHRQPGVPRDAETICLKCLEKQPAQRYLTAEALAQDLRRFQDGESITARRSTVLERAAKWTRRRPLVAALLGIIFVVTLLGFTGVFWKWQEAERNAAAARTARDGAQMQAAERAFARGVELAENGEVDVGLHWMLLALRDAPADAMEFQRAVRVNLAAWGARVHGLRHRLPHDAMVSAVAFSPDGGLLVTGCMDGYARRWDPVSGQLLGEKLGPHPGMVRTVAFARDGTAFLTGSEADRGGVLTPPFAVRRWDRATGKLLDEGPKVPERFLILLAGGPSAQHAFTFAFWGHGGDLFRWDFPAAGQVLKAHFDMGLISIGMGPDGESPWAIAQPGWPEGPYVFLRADQAAGKWLPVPADDPRLRTWRTRRSNGAVVLNDQPYLLYCRERSSGKLLSILRQPGNLTDCALSEDGRSVALCGPFGLLVREIATGRLRANLAHYGPMWYLDVRADGEQIAGGGRYSDRLNVGSDQEARVWDVARSLSRPPPNHWAVQEELRGQAWPTKSNLFAGAVVSPDRRTLALVRSFEQQAPLSIWDTAEDRPRAVLEEFPLFRATQVAYSPDGSLFVAGNAAGTLQVWDTRTWQALFRLTIDPAPGRLNALAFSADNRWLAVGDLNRRIVLVDVQERKLVRPPAPLADIPSDLAFSPDGQVLAAGTVSVDHRQAFAFVLDPAHLRPRGEPAVFETGGTVHVRIRPDGRVVLATNGTDALLLDAATGGVRGRLALSQGCTAYAFRSDNRLLATGGGDGVVHLWDADTGGRYPRARLLTHSTRSQVTSLDFSPDGRTLLCGYFDGTCRPWDVATSLPLGPPLVQRFPLLAVAFLPDGRSFLSTAADGATRTWPLPASLTDSVEAFDLRLAVRTGLRLSGEHAAEPLSYLDWRELRNQLQQTQGSGDLPVASAPLADAAWHDAQARDAEQDEDQFGALWHLERLLRLRPDDWLVLARQAHAQLLAGRPDEARAPAARARQLAGPRAWANWCFHQALDDIAMKHWESAEWHLKQAVAAEPDSAAYRQWLLRAQELRKKG